MASSNLYFKVTNELECHNGYQYVDGLNILNEKFNDSDDSCVPGRLYFSDKNHIMEYLNFGVYLREVILPINNPDFKMIKDGEDKYGANMIILGEKRDLRDPETWKYMQSIGISFKNYKVEIMTFVYKWKPINVIKYLKKEIQYFIHHRSDSSLRYLCKTGCLEEVIFCVNLGANIHAHNNHSIRLAAEYGHLDVVKYLVENRARIDSCDQYALRFASKNGQLDIVKYIMSITKNKTCNYQALRLAFRNGNLEIVKYLLEFEKNLEIKHQAIKKFGIEYCYNDYV
ncbi:ankyrin repeat protein [Saudi moumouvirus]|nr:ankyrin repeat protein [Saudi moumouvirus]